jgi:agmatinase
MESKVVYDPTVKWISEHWVDNPENREDVPTFSFLSIPFDYAVSHRPGTRFGPDCIIQALNNYSLYCTDKRVSLENTVLTHLGNVDILHSLEYSYKNIQDAVAKIPPSFIPVFLGGDHSISDPIIRGMKRRLPEKPFGIIVFDAHFDSRPPIPGKEHSGHWMKTLEDIVDYKSVVQLGINGCIYSESYMQASEQKGILVRTPYEIRKNGWEKTIRESIAHAMNQTEGIYISIDIDSIDQGFAPGTSVPNVSGLYPHEVINAIFEISLSSPIIGLDITEVSPPLDNLDFTSQIAAQLVVNFMAGVVSRLSS